MQLKEILLNKITQDQGIYPRFNTDPERVSLFCELLDCGTNLGPVKLVREDGYYVLLDGNHRLEAFRLKGRKKISAHIMQVEKRHWRLAAARFNNVSSKPLTRKELQKTIWEAWEIDGIQDTQEIAHELGCSVQYVRRILRESRQADRKELRNEVLEFKKQGLSCREIAEKTGIPKSTVHDLLMDDQVSEKETVSFPDIEETVENGQNNKKIASELSNIDPGPTLSEGASDDSHEPSHSLPETAHKPPSVIPELSKYGTLEPGQKKALRTLELIRADWTVGQISKELEHPEVSVRNVGAVLIALYQSRSPRHPYAGRSVDDIADGLGMKREVVAFLDEFLAYMPGIFPTRETVFHWLRKEDNSPPYRAQDCPAGSLTDIMRYESIYWKSVNDGVKCPWEEENDGGPRYEEVPEEVVKGFQEAMDFFRRLTDLIQTGAFDLVMPEVMHRYNLFLIVQNGFRDALMKYKEVL